MDVLDEIDGLQEFFEGQDVLGTSEDAIADTHMLEEFIGSELEVFGNRPSKLPDSPPDSGSEPCSPPQSKDLKADLIIAFGLTSLSD
uniref:Uncharacterized protein n=1 Tax=Sphaerodactylus townsendi TaxID=933632 RepID=A0ACB8FQ96_9SAUR